MLPETKRVIFGGQLFSELLSIGSVRLQCEGCNGLLHLFGCGIRGQGRADAHNHTAEEAAREPDAGFAVIEAEDTAPEIAEMERDDRDIRVFNNMLKPFFEGLHLAGPRELTLWKNYDEVAL